MDGWSDSADGILQWWVGMTDREEKGKHRWTHLAEEVKGDEWWLAGEPDNSGSCVSLSVPGGLHDEACDEPTSPLKREPLCKQGMTNRFLSKCMEI